MKCQKCGRELNANEKFCQNCGQAVYVQPQQQIHPHSYHQAMNSNFNSMKPVKQKKRLSTGAIVGITLCSILVFFVLIFIIMFTVALASPSSDSTSSSSENKQYKSKITETTVVPTEKVDVKANEQAKWEKSLDDIEHVDIDKEVLWEYGDFYTDKTILTVVDIDDLDSDCIKANTDNNDSYFYSLMFNFKDSSELELYSEDEHVAIYGVVGKKSSFDCLDIDDCHIVMSGDDATEKANSLSKDKDNQIQNAKKLQEQEKQQQEEKEQEEKQKFTDSCTTIDFDTLSRNPDKYKGNNYKFTGEVIQVSESWGDTVNLRINVTKKSYEYIDDEYWEDTIYATVEIPEGADRILEDDIITIWGTCDGLYSYTSILGSSVSLPKIDVKYYEIN